MGDDGRWKMVGGREVVTSGMDSVEVERGREGGGRGSATFDEIRLRLSIA
jgi:hypothetical protein